MSEVMGSWPWHVSVRVRTASGKNESVWVSTNVINSLKMDLKVEKWLTFLCPLGGSIWDPTGISRNVENSENSEEGHIMYLWPYSESARVHAGLCRGVTQVRAWKIGSQISDFTWVRGLVTFSRSWSYGTRQRTKLFIPDFTVSQLE